MGVIIGMIVTFGCVLGGYMAMGGKLSVLNQPFELVIIGGAAIGIFLVANPLSVVKDSGKAVLEAVKNSVPTRDATLVGFGVAVVFGVAMGIVIGLWRPVYASL